MTVSISGLSIIPTTQYQQTAAQLKDSSIKPGNPILKELDKATPPKPVVVNGTSGLQATYLGNGTVKGVHFTANGTVFIETRNDGFADLRGHAIITTDNGERGTYKFYSLGYEDILSIIY